MRNPLLMRFGRYCYSIYLLQFALLLLLEPVRNLLFQALHIATAPYELKLFIYYPIVLALLLITSFVTFNLIEKRHTTSVIRTKLG
jgi:peptidoglycan/LPS O-acetylase OafA/YrhL